MEKKLFRNEHDKMIAGVASGLADYLQVEVTIVRLLFALSAIFMAGGGLIAYIIMWIILPVKNDPAAKFAKFNDYFGNTNPNAAPFGGANQFEGPIGAGNTNWTQPVSDASQKIPFETQNDFNKFNKPTDTGRTIGGLLLLVIGCFFLMREFDFIPDWFRFRNFWPVIFIALGISIIAKSKRKNEWAAWESKQTVDEPKNETTSDAVIVSDAENTTTDNNNSTTTNPQV